MFKKIKRYLSDPYWALGCDMIKMHSKWMSDEFYLRTLWRMLMGDKLDLKNPKTVSEKIQWLKLHDHNPLHTILVDKVLAKEWISNHFGEQYVIPTIAKYTNADAIELDKLPEKFVLKSNHDSGSVFICYNKTSGEYYDKHMHKYTFDEVKEKLNEALKKNFYWEAREWAYKYVKPQIFVETILQCADGSIPNDYKLFFINGEFVFTYVSFDREGANDRCTYDKNWNKLPFVYIDHYRENLNTSDVPCPASYRLMLDFGKKISEHFKFVRIDLYDVDGKMYFGEVTPYHSGGFAQFYPSEYDAIYSELLKL